MQIDREKIIKEIQRITRQKGVNQITRSEFSAETGISLWQIYQTFDSWREACEEAGLVPHYQHGVITDNDLFEEMQRVFVNYGGLCIRAKFDKLSQYSVDTYKRRFGKWQEVLRAFHEWLEKEEIEFPFIDKFPPI